MPGDPTTDTTIVYKVDRQHAKVNFIDQNTNQVLRVEQLSGDSYSKSSYTTAEQIAYYVAQGYVLVRDGYPAGGIGDGRGVAAAYALGAQGIQAGTIFLTADETPVPDAFKQAVLDADDTATTVTGRRSGAPVRSIKNPMIAKYLELEYSGASRDALEELSLGSLSMRVTLKTVQLWPVKFQVWLTASVQ